MQMQADRIPDFTIKTFDGMSFWFSEMAVRKLIFHPDNPPDQVVRIDDGSAFFTPVECSKLKTILDAMFNEHGDRVYDACYPAFMKASGFPDANA
jgi:hypothetical protein